MDFKLKDTHGKEGIILKKAVSAVIQIGKSYFCAPMYLLWIKQTIGGRPTIVWVQQIWKGEQMISCWCDITTSAAASNIQIF